MILREFREPGIAAFRQFLAECRADPKTPYPQQLLEDDVFSSEVTPPINVEFRRLGTKADAAGYLTSILEPLSEQMVVTNARLWSWLTLFFFDDVCPAKTGNRNVKVDYYYVFEPGNSRRFYYHLLYISWYILHVAPKHNRLFLRSPVSSLDKVTEEVMKRLYLTRIPCMFEVLDRLYWDEKRGRSRSGIVTRRRVAPGDLIHRLPSRIRQLEKTYDLYSLDADQLIDLLGTEFQHNLPSGKFSLQNK